MFGPAIAAVLGAFLRYLIAVTLEYEFGAVAWLIGGAIGFIMGGIILAITSINDVAI